MHLFPLSLKFMRLLAFNGCQNQTKREVFSKFDSTQLRDGYWLEQCCLVEKMARNWKITYLLTYPRIVIKRVLSLCYAWKISVNSFALVCYEILNLVTIKDLRHYNVFFKSNIVKIVKFLRRNLHLSGIFLY